MPLADNVRIDQKSYLTADELRAVERLAAVCNGAEGLDLKLNLATSPDEHENMFLGYRGDELTGFCSLDGNRSLELCGMVHPEQRRHGIGRALLDAAVAEQRRRKVQILLLICEAASQSGRAFAATVGGTLVLAEYRMVLGTLQQRPPSDGRLQVRVAGPEDVVAVARALADASMHTEEEVQQYAARDLADSSQRVYLAQLGDEPVGALRASFERERVGIYGFGVRPEYQRRGFGRQALTTVCAALLAEGWTNIFLEVDTTNTRALALYRSCGFEETTTYGYYQQAEG